MIDVQLDTSSLIGHAAGPFSLNFQFNDGAGVGDGNNTVALSALTFGFGGSVFGPPATVGGASGNLNSGVMLQDSNFFNSFTQGFTPGSALRFRLSFTTNVDIGGTPDQFSFAILDSTGSELPTLGSFDAFLIFDIDSTTPTVQTFVSDTSRSPVAGGVPITIPQPNVQSANEAIPEPSTSVLVGTSFLLWLCFGRSVRRRML